MHENIRRLMIPARRLTDPKQPTEPDTDEQSSRDPSADAGPAPSDSTAADAHIRVELAEVDFEALKRILASLAGEDGRLDDEADESAGRRLAEIMFNMRQARSRLFPASMFNEPAWDMLMALFVAHEVSAAADLARWTQTPLTTAMRWIEFLESHKLIIRESSAADRRAHMIRLTDQGRANMEALFSDVVEQWR